MVRKASERAASLGASEEAQRYAERAIELTDGPLAAAELHERAGMMAWVRVDVDSATEHFRTAIELFEAEGATHPVARVSARLGEVVWSQGRGIDALESMAASYRVLADEEPDADLAQLAAQLGRFTFFNGETERAMEWIERSLEIAEALDLQEILSDALNTKSLVMLTFGRGSEATGLMRHALAIALEHDKPTAAQRAYNNLADLSDYDDRYPEAERMVGEGLSLARRVGNWYWESSLLGHVYPKYALGRWDDLMASLDEIPPDEYARSRIAFTQGYVAFGTAVEVHRGDLEAATSRLERFAELQTSADVQEVTEYACGGATLRLAQGDLKEALRLAEVALEGREALSLSHSCVKEGVITGLEAALALGDQAKFDEILAMVRTDPNGRRMWFFQAHGARFEARSADPADDGAEQLYRSAIASFREIGFPFWLAVTLVEYSEWLEIRGRGPDAAPIVLEARSIFEGLGARPWVDRAGRVGEASTVTS